MKKLVALALIVMCTMFILTACGNIETKVPSEYDDGFAKNYASDVKTDADGNNTYEFTDKQYEEFKSNYKVKVIDDAERDVLGVIDENGNDIEKPVRNYIYINPEGTECIVGVKAEHVEELGIEGCKKEAEELGKSLLKYNMNLQNSTGKITVIYKADTGNEEEYCRVEVTAE